MLVIVDIDLPMFSLGTILIFYIVTVSSLKTANPLKFKSIKSKIRFEGFLYFSLSYQVTERIK